MWQVPRSAIYRAPACLHQFVLFLFCHGSYVSRWEWLRLSSRPSPTLCLSVAPRGALPSPCRAVGVGRSFPRPSPRLDRVSSHQLLLELQALLQLLVACACPFWPPCGSCGRRRRTPPCLSLQVACRRIVPRHCGCRPQCTSGQSPGADVQHVCVLVALPVAMPAPLAARPRPLPHFGIPVGSGRGVYHAAGAPCRRGLVLEISLLVSWVAPLEPYFLSNSSLAKSGSS